MRATRILWTILILMPLQGSIASVSCEIKTVSEEVHMYRVPRVHPGMPSRGERRGADIMTRPGGATEVKVWLSQLRRGRADLVANVNYSIRELGSYGTHLQQAKEIRVDFPPGCEVAARDLFDSDSTIRVFSEIFEGRDHTWHEMPPTRSESVPYFAWLSIKFDDSGRDDNGNAQLHGELVFPMLMDTPPGLGRIEDDNKSEADSKADQTWFEARGRLETWAEQLRESGIQIPSIEDPISGESMYPRGAVLEMVSKYEEQVSSSFPAQELRSAREYAEDVVVRAQSSLSRRSTVLCQDCVTRASTHDMVHAVAEKLIRMSSFEKISVNIKASSNPSGARAELLYAKGDQVYRETTTDNTLPNVYRGRYRVTMRRQGCKPGSLEINLFEDDGTKLHCTLPQSDNATEATCMLSQ